MGNKLKKIDTKDTILYLYHLIKEQIDFNEEFRVTDAAKRQRLQVKREIKNLSNAINNLSLTQEIPDDSNEKRLKDILKDFKNTINQIDGKDYYFVVDDGFKTYRVKKSELESKSPEEVNIYFLKKFGRNINEVKKEVETDIKKKIDIDKNKKTLIGLIKLRDNVDRNIETVNEGGEYEYDDYYSNVLNDEAYPIFVDVVDNYVRIGV